MMLVDQFDRDSDNEELVAKGLQVFDDLGIKLFKPKSDDTEMTFSQILKESTLNRTQYLIFIEHWERLWQVLKKGSTTRSNHDQV